MSTRAERLRAARKKRFATATEAAEAMGVVKHSYIQHENGTRDFDDAAAELYARRLGTTPEWLMFGRGAETSGANEVRIVGMVGASPDGRVVFSESSDSYDFTTIPPTGTANSIALEVRGHSMRGFADDGALIFIEDQRTPPTPDMLGNVVVVELENGEVLIKRLLRGSEPGLYDLESVAGPTLPDARIKWAAHVTAIVPPYQARRVIRRTAA